MPPALQKAEAFPAEVPAPPERPERSLEAELAHVRAELTRERDRAEELEANVGRLAARLHDLETSTAWRAASLYYRVRDGVPVLRAAHGLARSLKARIRALSLPGAAGVRLRGEVRGDLVGLTLGRRGRVSVVLPVFNQAGLLAESIESVLAQSYPDLELVVVNDGSTDGVEPILARFADDPRVVVLTQPNQKLPSALNNGFAAATGEYFTWTSADNVMLPHQVETLVRHLEAHPAHGLAYSDYQAIDEAGRPLRDPTFRPQNQDPSEPSRMRLPREASVANLFRSGDNFIGASFLYRRDAAKLVGPYAEDTFGGEDYDFWLRLQALFELGHVPEVLYRYRVHANTLNARARELRIAESVGRLRARHAERLAALERGVSVLRVGVSLRGARAPADGTPPDVVLYRLSRSDEPAVRAQLGRPDVLAVAVVDRELDEVDDRDLSAADLVLTRTAAVQTHAERALPMRAFLLDPARDPDLVLGVAAYRLFEKRAGHRLAQPAARVLPVAEPLRVGIQADGLDRGGLEQVVVDLVRHLSPSRVRATVLVHARDAGAAGRLLQREGADVVVTGGDERALLRAVDERRLQVVNHHHSLTQAAAYRARGVATVYTAHSAYIWMSEQERATRAAALRDMDLTLCVSDPVSRYVVQRFGVDARRLVVVPNGLDPRDLAGAPATPRATLGLGGGDLVFLQVGRFVREKLQGATVEAFRRIAAGHPDARLVLAGAAADAAYTAEVREALRASGVEDRVRVVHEVDRARVAGLLQVADCLVHPSLVEGWSVAVMEAMYFGLPLVLTDVGSARAVVRDGDIGIVLPNPYPRLTAVTVADIDALSRRYPERNVESLAGAMREVADDREAWRARAAAGRARVATEYGVRSMAEGYEDAFLAAFRRFRKPPRA